MALASRAATRLLRRRGPLACLQQGKSTAAAVQLEEDEDFAEHEYGYGEYDFRHPGTSWESDDEEERGDNEIFSPISTRAGQELGSILLVGKGGTPAVELKAAYDMQLSVRVDEKRLALCYAAIAGCTAGTVDAAVERFKRDVRSAPKPTDAERFTGTDGAVRRVVGDTFANDVLRVSSQCAVD